MTTGNHKPPEYHATNYHCPYGGVLARHYWADALRRPFDGGTIAQVPTLELGTVKFLRALRDP